MSSEPRAFGQPISFALYGICLIHLILCIVIMASLVIGTTLDVGGVLVSPLVQWLYGSFTLVSIVAIICAGVGALFHIESHLNAYGWVLLISSFIDAFFLVVFLFLGKSCRTTHHNANHLVATMSCGIHDGMALLCLTLLVIFKLLALFIVNKCGAHVRSAYNQKLIPFAQKDDIGAREALKQRALEASHLEPSTLAPGSEHWMPSAEEPMMWNSMPASQAAAPVTYLPSMRASGPASFVPQNIGSMLPSMRSYATPLRAMQSMPQTMMSMLPSMGSNTTSFGATPFPGTKVPSMVPSSLGMNAYGAAAPATIKVA